MSAAAAYALYLAFTLGGAAVFFMLPQGVPVRRGVASLFGLSALAALLVVLATRVTATDPTPGYFYLFSAVALFAAARVITHTRPVYSALYFLLVVIAVAAMLVLLKAEFLAVALIIIYAGAILVTYLFVIMLAQQPGQPVYDRRAREPLAAVLAGFVLMAAIAGKAAELPKSTASGAATVAFAGRLVDGSNGSIGERPSLPSPQEKTTAERSNSLAVGELLMTKHVVTLQVAGILLLISMVGAIALSRRKVTSDVWQAPRAPLGQIGKEVEPF